MPAGRPRKYDSPEEMDAKIKAYFADEDTGTPTMAGLCLYLGFCDRHALLEYETYEGFSATVKKARTRIEMDRAQRLVHKDTFTPGLIFDLKNNHGWKDKTEQEMTGPDGGPVQNVHTVEIIGVRPDDYERKD